jgi:hypothetical protein
VTSGNDQDVVISTEQKFLVMQIVQHELCHVIGALDKVCTPEQRCVMSYTLPEINKWCDNCRDLINSHLEKRRNAP